MSRMLTDVLVTKLFVPLPRPNAVARPALIARLTLDLDGYRRFSPWSASTH